MVQHIKIGNNPNPPAKTNYNQTNKEKKQQPKNNHTKSDINDLIDNMLAIEPNIPVEVVACARFIEVILCVKWLCKGMASVHCFTVYSTKYATNRSAYFRHQTSGRLKTFSNKIASLRFNPADAAFNPAVSTSVTSFNTVPKQLLKVLYCII